MKRPRRSAVVITGLAGLLAASACAVTAQADETPPPTAEAAPIAPAARPTASPSAEFVPPLYVPTPPAGVLSSAGGSEVLGPDDVVTPSTTVPPRAVIRPA